MRSTTLEPKQQCIGEIQAPHYTYTDTLHPDSKSNYTSSGMVVFSYCSNPCIAKQTHISLIGQQTAAMYQTAISLGACCGIHIHRALSHTCFRPAYSAAAAAIAVSSAVAIAVSKLCQLFIKVWHATTHRMQLDRSGSVDKIQSWLSRLPGTGVVPQVE